MGSYNTYTNLGERSRLNLQASTNSEKDMLIIKEMFLQQIELGKKEVVIYEHGGSSLETRVSVFQMLNQMSEQFGIKVKYYNFEHNAAEVEKSRKYETKTFKALLPNIEIKSFLCDLSTASGLEMLELAKGEKCDILLSSYVIQHIGFGLPIDQARAKKRYCLEQLNTYMNDTADIFFRCPDDKLKVLTPGYGFDDEECRLYAEAIVTGFCNFFPYSSDRFYGSILNCEMNELGYDTSQVLDISETSESFESREAILERDFKWYVLAFDDEIKRLSEEKSIDNNRLTEARQCRAKIFECYEKLHNRFVIQGIGKYCLPEPFTISKPIVERLNMQYNNDSKKNK